MIEIISAPHTLTPHESRHGNQGLVSRNIMFLFLVPSIKGLPRFVQDTVGHKHTALTSLQDKNKNVHILTELPHRPRRLRLMCHSLSSIHDLNPFFPADPLLVVGGAVAEAAISLTHLDVKSISKESSREDTTCTKIIYGRKSSGSHGAV